MNPIGSLLRIAAAVTAVALLAQFVLSGLQLPRGLLGAFVLALLIAAVSAPLIQSWVLGQQAELVAAAQAGRAGRAEFRALLDVVAEGVILVDSEGRIRHLNRQAEVLFGFERTELINQPVELLIPERFRDAHVRYREEFMARPDQVPLGIGRELVGRRRDGGEIPVELSLSPIAAEGDVRVLALVSDISVRKRLQEEKDLLARAIEQSVQAVVITDAGGRIQYVNRATEMLSGYSREELIGRRPSVLKSGKHSSSFFQEMWTALTNGRIWQSKILNRRKDGTLYEQDSTIAPVCDSSGRVTHYVSIAHEAEESAATDLSASRGVEPTAQDAPTH